MRLRRILSTLLLVAGALAWLLGPSAPAQPRGATDGAGGEAEEEPLPVEIWLDDPPLDSGPPRREAEEAEWTHREPVRIGPLAQPAGGGAEGPEWSESEPDEPDAATAREAAPAPPDGNAALDLVRRMLGLHARMRDE